jgi:hypothetical protein
MFLSLASRAELSSQAIWRHSNRGPDIILEDNKAVSTNGGAFTTGADRTRDLNTKVWDPNNWCILAANQFTLPAGIWKFDWACPAFYVGRHQSLLYSITDAALVARGSNSYSNAGSGGTVGGITYSVGDTVPLAFNKPTTFEIRHRCLTTEASDGFGVAGQQGTEVYTRVEITRKDY